MTSEVSSQNLAFIGTGAMSGAILRGYLRVNQQAHVRATTNSVQSANLLRTNLSAYDNVYVRAISEDDSANYWAVKSAQTVVLGVKPWAICEVLADIAESLEPDATVVSVAAGVPLHKLRAALGKRSDVTVVRAMPNTPSLVGKGVAGITTDGVQQEKLSTIENIFAAVGSVVLVPEAQIDALSAVSGSGPAYLFWFVEQLTAAAQRLGFSEEIAALLATETVIGSSALLAASNESPTQLRCAVTSPNGTTERAIAAFNNAAPADIFDTALQAAILRAAELAAE